MKNKFKIGDKVKVIENPLRYQTKHLNHIGTVININNCLVNIKFKNNITWLYLRERVYS